MVIEPLTNGGSRVKILTLPDLSKPRHIKHKAGWGSLHFGFKLENGVLTEFGSTQDTRGLETLATVSEAVPMGRDKGLPEIVIYEIGYDKGGKIELMRIRPHEQKQVTAKPGHAESRSGAGLLHEQEDH